MTLQSLFASKYPNDPKSLEIFDRSLFEIDGPNPGEFTTSFEHDSNAAERLLSAAVTVPVDVRMAVGSVLLARNADYGTCVEMTPDPYAEYNSSVRSTCLMALARAAKGSVEYTNELAEKLELELTALGSELGKRRRSALAALLNLGLHERVAHIMRAEKSPSWTHHLIDWIDTDPTSIGAVIEHWEVLQPLLQQQGIDAELPVGEIVSMGFSALLEHKPWGREVLDGYFETESRDWVNSEYLEVLAKRHKSISFSRERLLTMIADRWSRGAAACTAARLLAQNYHSLPDIWGKLSERYGQPDHIIGRMTCGVLGHLVLGWPNGKIASSVRSISAEQHSKLSPRDRLLIAVAQKDATSAEAAATDMLVEQLEPWRYHEEDTHALRIWSRSGVAHSTLVRWIDSDNASLSATALSLIASGDTQVALDIDKLVDRFNDQFTHSGTVPKDGLNAISRRHIGWSISVYSDLRPSLAQLTKEARLT